MADEVTDSLNKEVCGCNHWIDEHLQPHKDFVGIHHLDTNLLSKDWRIYCYEWICAFIIVAANPMMEPVTCAGQRMVFVLNS